MSFVHLHTHSYYSLLDGSASPEALINRCLQLRFDTLALTDHNALYGAVEFYKLAKEAGIKPIIGAEIRIADDNCRLVALVENAAGYRNLCHLLSIGHLAGGHLQFQLPLKELIRLKDGLIILSGGQEGYLWKAVRTKKIAEAQRYCRQMKQIFGRKFCIELQLYHANNTLVQLRMRDLAAQCRMAVVATNDVHFLDKKDWPLRQILHAIDENTLVDNITTAGNEEQYLKSATEMTQLFKAFPQAIENTRRIADTCRFEFSLGKAVFPALTLPDEENSYSLLCKLAFQGACDRYGNMHPAAMRRLTSELETINSMGFNEYFLIVKDIVDFCNREDIPCVGRGSAGDSLISYVLGITHVDPLHYKLCFERFLNDQRPDPPDIDLDICWKNRDRVLEYVFENYGKSKTAMICTFSTFKVRSAIRDISKVFGFPRDEIDALTKYLPNYHVKDMARALRDIPECRHLRGQASLLEKVFSYARMISNFPRHLSIHSGGIIIAPEDIHYYTPLQTAAKGTIISQYDMHSIEDLGLVKMDLLGVRSLSIITDCLQEVKKYYRTLHHSKNGKPKRSTKLFYRYTIAQRRIIPENSAVYLTPGRFPFLDTTRKLSPLDLRSIPDSDQKVVALMRHGLSMGCFQAESPAMRSLLGKLQISHVADVIAAVAIVRPGAASDGRKDLYVQRRAGLKPIRYAHSRLRPILGETYGGIVYEEQVMEIVAEMTSLSLGEADLFRRKLAKSDDPKIKRQLRKTFLEKGKEDGLAKTEAERVWEFLSQFKGYSFNKAHACSYGVISYQTAFLKYYFPVQYMTGVLNNYGGYYSTAAYVAECRRIGIQLELPDINRSERVFTCYENTILTGLGSVEELTDKTIQQILAERQKGLFKDYYDFMQRVQPRVGEVDNLIRCGALRSFSDNEPALLLKNKLFFKNKRVRGLTESMMTPVDVKPYTGRQRILAQLEILGFAVTDHPLTLLNGRLSFADITVTTELADRKEQRVTILGWMVTHRRMATKNDEYMKFMTLEDQYGLCEAVLFPQTYKRYGHLTRGPGPYKITGTVQSRLPGEVNVIAERIEVVKLTMTNVE